MEFELFRYIYFKFLVTIEQTKAILFSYIFRKYDVLSYQLLGFIIGQVPVQKTLFTNTSQNIDINAEIGTPGSHSKILDAPQPMPLLPTILVDIYRQGCTVQAQLKFTTVDDGVE